MLDLTTLLYYAAMGLALVGADAYWYADSIVSKVEVAKKYVDDGVSADFATTLFSHELQTIFANESIVRTPDIRAANDQSVISVIANSLKLEDLTYAFQHMFGLDPVQVKVAVMDHGAAGQAILVTSTSRTRTPFSMVLVRGQNEEMPHFIRRAAVETASRLDTYHTALYLLERKDVEQNVDSLKTLLQNSIDRLPPTPDNPERALFRNLQGIVALLEKDLATAASLFEKAVNDTDNYAAALLNLAFVRTEQDRYEEAIELIRPVIERRARPRNPALTSAAHTIRGVANWSLKRHSLAERDFASAAKYNPGGTDFYIYWGVMLTELGRAAEGAEKRRIGEQNLELFEQYPEVALLYFWLDEKEGSRLNRRTLEHPSARMMTSTDNVSAPSNQPAKAATARTPGGNSLLKD